MTDKRLAVLIEAAFGFLALAGTVVLLASHQPEGAAVLAPIATFAIGHVMPGPSSGLPAPADMPVMVSGPPDMAARVTHVPRETAGEAGEALVEMGAAIERRYGTPRRADGHLPAPPPRAHSEPPAPPPPAKRAPRRTGRETPGHDPHRA